jgi:hypothetical protein
VVTQDGRRLPASAVVAAVAPPVLASVLQGVLASAKLGRVDFARLRATPRVHPAPAAGPETVAQHQIQPGSRKRRK